MVALAVGVTAALAAPAARAADTVGSNFANPSISERPMYRFWNGGGSMDPATFNNELDQIKANGGGGIEASTFSTQNATTDPSYTTTESFGTPLWTQNVTDLIKAGTARGLRVDEIYSPRWSGSINTITPDTPGSAKELTLGRAWVDGGATFSGAVPTAALPSGATKRTLIAVLAYRCVLTCGANAIATLDQSSVKQLTPDANGNVSFTAPAGSDQWVVIGAWMNGTGQTVGAGLPTTSYLLDHYSIDGWNALKDYWEAKVLTPELKAAWAANGGSLFFDSLELNRSGVQVRSWTPDFLAQFKSRRGYDLTPYLPVLAITGAPSVAAPSSAGARFEFQGDLGDRIREDYDQTLSDLFRDNHLIPAQNWAHSLGLTLRGQAYSSWGPSPLDAMEMYGKQDIAEGEDRSFESASTLAFIQTRGTDAWRAMSSAVEMAGKTKVSTECCAEGTALRYPRQTLVSHMNHQFAAGVNQIVFHGWSHKAPKLATTWPGWGGFNYGTADDYGPHNPTWGSGDDAKLNDYVGRVQTVMRTGRERNDIAIYHQGIGHSIAGLTADHYWADNTLAAAGYRYGYLNKTMIASDNATVSGGRLDPSGQQFKAFVYDGTPNENNETAMDVATAQKVAAWANAGLPVYFVAGVPTRVLGDHPDQDAALQSTIASILGKPNVHQVATQADLAPTLRAAGITPAASFATPVDFISTRRESDDANYYFFYNQGATRETTQVTLTGTGLPYKLDAWTGRITPIAAYTKINGGVRVSVTIASGDAAILAVRNGTNKAAATSTTADDTLYDANGNLAIRGTGGTYSTTLADGRTVSTKIDPVPAAKTLTDWTLNVTSYQQGLTLNDTAKVPMGPYTLTAGTDGTLPNWRAIPDLVSKAGIGTYTTAVNVDWPGGAYLDLGSIPNTNYQVTVNGTDVAYPDQIDPARSTSERCSSPAPT